MNCHRVARERTDIHHQSLDVKINNILAKMRNKAILTNNNKIYTWSMKRYTPLLLLLFSHFTFAEDKLTVVTEHWPPYQIVENGIAIDGFATMVVKAMLKEAGTPMTIRGFNWARAYKMALERPNVMVFGLFRSKERERKFKWVGQLLRQVNSLWYLKGHKVIDINTLQDAKAYRIAVAREDIRHQFLINQGFNAEKNIVVVRDHTQAVSMLFLKRTDLVLSDKRNIALTATTAGFDPQQLAEVPDVSVHLGELYIACSLKTPDEVVALYADALERIKQKGIYDQIKAKYLPEHRY